MKNLIKGVIVGIIALVLWVKVIKPWLNKPADVTGTGGTSSAVTQAGGSSCTELAARASETWGSGVGSYANPPVDMANWDAFQARVSGAIGTADAACTSCSSDSCVKARQAVSDLRSLVSAFDSALRAGGAPPSDAVQQQEHIDQTIDQARELARQGK